MRPAGCAVLAAPAQSLAAAGHSLTLDGQADTDYYRGEVTGSTPAQTAWVKEHRPDDPTLPGGAGLDAANVPGPTAAVMAATVAGATKQGTR